MPALRPALQAVGLWALTAAVAFDVGGFARNEVDTLPSARHWAQPSWLPHDWYLGLDIGYRVPFNALAGTLVENGGFVLAAVVVRLLGMGLFAVATWLAGQALGVRYGWLLLATAVFLWRQDVAAGEWVVGGAESKALAWPLALMAVAALLHRRVGVAALAAGLAASFHVLVGLSVTGALLVGALLTRRSWDWTRRDLLRAWPLLPAGGWGWAEVVRQLAPGGGVGGGDSAGWLAYVTFRVRHHLLPSAWDRDDWVPVLVVALAVPALLWWRDRHPAARLLAATALASSVLFGVGLLLWVTGQLELLRFYWFRFPDSFLLWSGGLLLAAVLSRVEAARAVASALAVAIPLVAVVSLIRDVREFDPDGWDAAYEGTDTLEWVAAHTAPDSRLLLDPRLEQVYVTAGRAVLVTYKHSPQGGADLTEWASRMETVSGVPIDQDALLSTIRAGFDAQSTQRVLELARQHDLDYWVVRRHVEVELPVLHVGRTHQVVDLRDH